MQRQWLERATQKQLLENACEEVFSSDTSTKLEATANPKPIKQQKVKKGCNAKSMLHVNKWIHEHRQNISLYIMLSGNKKAMRIEPQKPKAKASHNVETNLNNRAQQRTKRVQQSDQSMKKSGFFKFREKNIKINFKGLQIDKLKF